MGFREGSQLQKQGEGEERQEIQGHTGWKEKTQKTSVEAALVDCVITVGIDIMRVMSIFFELFSVIFLRVGRVRILL